MRVAEPIADMATTLWLITHADLRKAARIRAFLDFIAPELGRLKPRLEGSIEAQGSGP
jgi:hypothetical protein